MAVVRESVSVESVNNLADGGFHIRSVEWNECDGIVVTAPTDDGLVYGTFYLLRLMATGEPIDDLALFEEPGTDKRIINHWDNPFRRSVERGYAGQSLFD